MYLSKLYIGTITSRSAALSITTLLIFDKQLINGALSIKPLPSVFVRLNVPKVTFCHVVCN